MKLFWMTVGWSCFDDPDHGGSIGWVDNQTHSEEPETRVQHNRSQANRVIQSSQMDMIEPEQVLGQTRLS